MSEIHGREANVGDLIIVGSQVGRITAIDVESDRLTYQLTDGGGINIISTHVSNTPFELVDGHGALADRQVAVLEGHEKNVSFISDPTPEDPDTDRVKGEPGAKLNGKPATEEVTDEFTTAE